MGSTSLFLFPNDIFCLLSSSFKGAFSETKLDPQRLPRLAILSREPSRTPNLGRFRIRQTAKLFPTGSACAGQPYDPASSTAARSN
jgi:hypothetical protein